MVKHQGFMSTIKRAASLNGLIFVVGYLLLGTVIAGPLQDRVRTLTYHQELQAFLADITFVYHDVSLGIVVVHLDSRSRVHVWHRNSASVLSGRWGASTQSGNATMLCLDLGSSLPRLSGVSLVAVMAGDTPCYSLLSFTRGVQNTLEGDPYGLRGSRSAPAVIPDARRYTAQALMQLVGGSASALRNVDLSR